MLNIEITELKNEISVIKLNHLEEKAKIYNDLFLKEQDFVHDQAKRLIDNPRVTNNTIKGKYINMSTLNLTSERLESIKDTYTIKHYEMGGAGQADW